MSTALIRQNALNTKENTDSVNVFRVFNYSVQAVNVHFCRQRSRVHYRCPSIATYLKFPCRVWLKIEVTADNQDEHATLASISIY